jgi:hypothetical protein
MNRSRSWKLLVVGAAAIALGGASISVIEMYLTTGVSRYSWMATSD